MATFGLSVASSCKTNSATGGGGISANPPTIFATGAVGTLTATVPAAWTPASLFASSPMEQGAWYDPSDLTSVWTDDGVTQAGVGDLVYRIDDKSGNGNHARQATEANRPILRQDGSGNYYLDFDGVNDSLATNAIDFTATDEHSAFTGVTKDTDTAIQMLYELSVNAATNNGTFNAALCYQGTKFDAAGYFAAMSRGTANISGKHAVSPSGYTGPITVVHTHLADISADSSLLRINGSQVASNTNDQGTGNYGNYPLIIGVRSGGTFPLDGRIYSLIIRGKTSTSEEIANAESYVAGKAGVTLA